MKNIYKILLAVVLLTVIGFLGWKFLLPKEETPKEPETQDPSSEATIQEDNGDIIITIPDDQESAGE